MRRTSLFIPGNSPGMILNSAIFGADSIILDLEDAVSPSEKDTARYLVKNALKSMDFSRVELIIRINPIATAYWLEDLAETIPYGPDVIMPTKIQSAEDIKIIDDAITKIENEHGIAPLKTGIVPLLETALGIENSFQIATASKRIQALYLGGEDLSADLRVKRTRFGKEIEYSRTRLVVAARSAELPAIDTPFTDVDDMEGLAIDTENARAFGFSGKAVISPKHIDTVNDAFTPTDEEITYAKRVMEIIELAKKQGKGAVSLEGKMIDAPIVERARQTLEMANLIYGGTF